MRFCLTLHTKLRGVQGLTPEPREELPAHALRN